MKHISLFILFISIVTILFNTRSSFAQTNHESEKKVGSFEYDTTLVSKYITKAEKLSDEAKYDSSNFYFEKAIDIIKKIIIEHDDPKLREKFVQCYNEIGENHILKCDYEEALKLIQVALEVGIEHFGENHLDVATSHENIGHIYDRTGNYEKALEYFHRSLDIRKNIPRRRLSDIAQSYNNIGVVYHRKGDYDKALEYFHNSLTIYIETLGEYHPDVATSYNNIGSIYDGKGDYGKALEYYQKSLNIDLKIFGENHPNVAISYGNMAGVYSNQGKFKRALEYYQKSLDIKLETLGENHLDVATSYNSIGIVYFSKGDHATALEYYKKGLNIRLRNLGNEHPDLAFSYNNIGMVYSRDGDFENALENYQKSLNIRLKALGGNHPYVASSYNNIGYIYDRKGDYDKAIEYHQKSLDIRLSVLGSDHPSVATCYNNMGLAYDSKGDYKKALKYYQKSIDILLKEFGDIHPYIASTYDNMGGVFSNINDFENAIEYHIKSLNIRLKILDDNHPEVANSYNNIGVVYNRKGDYDQALGYHKKSLNIRCEIFGENHPDVASSYNNIGFVYQRKNEYENALRYYQNCLNIKLETYGDDHPSVASSFHNIGSVYYNLHDYEKALEYYQKSLNIRYNIFGLNNPFVAESYNNIGIVYKRNGKYNEALTFFQKALTANIEDFDNFNIYVTPNLKNILSNQILLVTLREKAETLFKLFKTGSKEIKNIKTAHATYQLTVALIDTIRGSFQAESSKLFLAEQISEIYDQTIRSAITLYDLNNKYAYKQQAFALAEKSKAVILWETLLDAKARKFGGIPDQFLEKEQNLRIDLAFYETQIQKLKQKKDQKDTDLINEFEARLFDLKREYENLIVKFEKEYPKYYDLKYQTETTSVNEIQKSFDAKTCLIEYFIGDSSLYIFTISKDDYDVLSFNIDSTFVPLLSDYYTSISKYDRKLFAQNSHQLYQILIQPVEDKLKGKDKLIIIPDGMLYSIPFEALISKEAETDDFTQLDYLIKQYDISYHYSANLWLRGVETVSSPKSKGFIAFAPVFSDQLKNSYIALRSTDQLDLTEIDVNYLRSNSISEEGNRKKFIPLPASEEEVRSIANLFNQKNSKADLYLHQEAKEEHLKTKARDYKYVHIATHGWMDEERPKLSGIAFSQPTDTVFQEDGILYSSEMYNLDLNADLVVLSACESGLGKLIKGEGPLSLTRGLLYSGANNIIISLWAVSDIYTGELMVELYKNILKGESYSKALRKAKLKMIENEQSAFPAKWSGFVLMGM